MRRSFAEDLSLYTSTGARKYLNAAEKVAEAAIITPEARRKQGSAAPLPEAHRRILHAIFESRQAQADREIARFLARSGGRFTDDIERQLTQHLLTDSWSVREG